jgi:transposase InsO family protein
MRIRHGSWRAGCITKGARPVWKARIRNWRQQCRTALMLDLSEIDGLVKWSYFYLYVFIDIFSRRIVAWCIADAESAALFKSLFDDAVAKHRHHRGTI